MDSTVEKRLLALERLRTQGRFGLTTLATEEESRAAPVQVEESEAPVDRLLNKVFPPASPPGVTAEQLAWLLDQQPPDFDLNKVFDPGSSTLEEIDQRCRELHYRVAWLEALLTVTREELALFAEAGKTFKSTPAG
jgi:hypothetical protein